MSIRPHAIETKTGLLFVACFCLCSAGMGQENLENPEESLSSDVPQTQIEISPETTVLTTPLDERGYLHVGGAINDFLKAGVEHEDNAAVDFLKALGGRAEGQEMTYACEQLGIEIHLVHQRKAGVLVQGAQQVPKRPEQTMASQGTAVDVLDHTQFLHQAQVLPERADATPLSA